MTKKKVYIAGPMRGYEEYNYPAFYKAEEFFKEMGMLVINPARINDAHSYHFDEFPLDYVIRKDVNAVLECDCIYMLNGWGASEGANAEWAIAVWAGKEVMYEPEEG